MFLIQLLHIHDLYILYFKVNKKKKFFEYFNYEDENDDDDDENNKSLVILLSRNYIFLCAIVFREGVC